MDNDERSVSPSRLVRHLELLKTALQDGVASAHSALLFVQMTTDEQVPGYRRGRRISAAAQTLEKAQIDLAAQAVSLGANMIHDLKVTGGPKKDWVISGLPSLVDEDDE